MQHKRNRDASFVNLNRGVSNETKTGFSGNDTKCGESNVWIAQTAVAKRVGERFARSGVLSRVSDQRLCILLDMHSKDLRAAGETEQRLYVLEAWRESPFYSDRERAALAWAEAVTTLSNKDVPDEVYEQARAQFSEAELVNLTLAVIAINGWNRLNIFPHNTGHI